VILEIQFSPEAEITFESVITQLQQRWGDKVVDKFKDRVTESLDIIAKTPLIYPISKVSTELRQCILHKNCSMLYKVLDTKIEIFCFWDNRQDPVFLP
jgi:plasmid stabilization system protein ParE